MPGVWQVHPRPESKSDVQAAIDAAYDEYHAPHAAAADKGAEIIATPVRRAGASSCWRAAPTMWTRRSTTASTSSSPPGAAVVTEDGSAT